MSLPKTTPPEPELPVTPEVAGLAPELKSAKQDQGSKPLASASERFTSYDVEAFEVPSFREENWRFTPRRRLRGLEKLTAFDAVPAVSVTETGGATGPPCA